MQRVWSTGEEKGEAKEGMKRILEARSANLYTFRDVLARSDRHVLSCPICGDLQSVACCPVGKHLIDDVYLLMLALSELATN